jgi:hypothetical protein
MSNDPIARIIVIVDDQHVAEVQAIATTVQAVGMTVDNVLATTGMITGTAPQSKIPDLKQVAGVADVEMDQEMRAI